MDWQAVLSILLRLLAVVALVLLNGFFVAAEFALVKVRDTQLRPLINRGDRSEEHTSELQSQSNLVCRLLLEKKKHRWAREHPDGPNGPSRPAGVRRWCTHLRHRHAACVHRPPDGPVLLRIRLARLRPPVVGV